MSDEEYNEAEFPYPEKLTRETFLNTIERYEEDDGKLLLDKFMFENYRFVALEDLSRDLRGLLKELDDELINLINTDYDEFIKLGKSVDGSIELINSIKFDLNSYYNELSKNKRKLLDTDGELTNLAQYKTDLQSLKKICQNLILINNQFDTFNHLLQQELSNVNKLIGLYLSIHKNLKVTCIFISKRSLDPHSIDFIKNLIQRSNLLRFEFQTYLDQVIDSKEAHDMDRLSASTFKRYLF